jgi:hypothetical protein
MKILGVALLIIGLGLAYWGYQQGDSISSQLAETVTGSPTDKVMMLYIGGAVGIVVGLLLMLRK